MNSTLDGIPEEDRFLYTMSGNTPKCVHDYVDFYCGWGPAKDNRNARLVWVFCKKCLDRKQIRLDMSKVDFDDE